LFIEETIEDRREAAAADHSRRLHYRTV